MITFFKTYYANHPLRAILLAALFFRIVAAVFSRGYGFSDDHFLVIEVAEQWTKGIDEKAWMPWNGNTTPSGHSLFYPGLHYYLFTFLNAIGLTNPEVKMLIVRLLHALYSLLLVLFGYKIARKLDSEQIATAVGWVLALLWFVPMMSVRNAVELVCIPPLLVATWLVLKARDTGSFKQYLLAGIIVGIAFSIRFQTMMFIGGLGLLMLLNKDWKAAIAFGMGALISIVGVQGTIDMMVWGRPFAEFTEYTLYNFHHSGEYPNGPWYLYTLLLAGILIPPVSFCLFFGMFREWKKYIWILFPAMMFFLFHSYFPNKQERFILPVVPFFIIAGIGGWNLYLQRSKYWQAHPRLWNNILIWFWLVNLVLLCFLTPSSTKISRVDVISYLRGKGDCNSFMLETTHMWGSVMMPRFYLNNWNIEYDITQEENAQMVFDSIRKYNLPLPGYIIFAEPKGLEERIAKVKEHVKGLEFEAEIASSYLDKTMTFLNPVNVNQTYYIYRIRY